MSVLTARCEEGEFECMDRQCLSSYDLVCDGKADCDDSSDENNHYARCFGKSITVTGRRTVTTARMRITTMLGALVSSLQ